MSRTVLIIDDSSMMRKIIRKLLETEGYEIIAEAGSGEEGIDKYKELKPDLVTMDITMRGIDGISAAREIKVYDDAARILFMSNLDEDKYRDEIEKLGGLGIASKHNSQDTLNLLNNVNW